VRGDEKMHLAIVTDRTQIFSTLLEFGLECFLEITQLVDGGVGKRLFAIFDESFYGVAVPPQR
jgi:hypothetical protein